MKSEKNNFIDIILKHKSFFFVMACMIIFTNCKKKCDNSGTITFSEPIIAVDDEAFRIATGNQLGDGPLLFNDSLELVSNVKLEKITNVNTTKYSYVWLGIFANKAPSRPHKIKLQLLEEQTNYVIQIKFCTERWGTRKARSSRFLLQTEKLNNKPVELKFIYD